MLRRGRGLRFLNYFVLEGQLVFVGCAAQLGAEDHADQTEKR